MKSLYFLRKLQKKKQCRRRIDNDSTLKVAFPDVLFFISLPIVAMCFSDIASFIVLAENINFSQSISDRKI